MSSWMWKHDGGIDALMVYNAQRSQIVLEAVANEDST